MRREPLAHRGRIGLLLILLGLALSACGIRNPRLGPLPMTAASLATVPEPYRIQPGDELEIRFFHTPDQNVVLKVRPDGYISLPLVYELLVAGRTAEDVRLELTARCSAELADPEIAVILRSFSGYQVHVGGEVGRPGVLELTGPRTVMQAVFESGGFLPTASLKNVFVVRLLETGGYEIVAADLDAVLSGKSGRGNFQLRAFDVVYVPTTPIADVNKFVDQYVRKNLPINFTYRLDT